MMSSSLLSPTSFGNPSIRGMNARLILLLSEKILDSVAIEVIIKQMALNDIGSCSIGKLRSYPCKLIGNLWGHYNNNIFFTWGEDSALRIKNTFNTLDNILISGFPYKIKNVKSHYESLEIKKQFQFKGEE